MNSFNFLEQAISAEITRQIALYTSNPDTAPEELIAPGTYRWDTEIQQTVLMRRKESADDYRYFPEPDLLPLILTQSYIDEIAAELPELPHDRFKRYVTDLGLSEYNASILINDKKLSDYFEEANLICMNPKILCNWITIEFAGRYKESGKSLLGSGITPRQIAQLIQLIDQGKVTGRIAKSVADDMVANPGLDPSIIVQKNPDYQPMDSSSEIEPIVDQVLAENAQSIADCKAGNERAFGFLVGQVMKLSRGKASPQIVNELLRRKL